MTDTPNTDVLAARARAHIDPMNEDHIKAVAEALFNHEPRNAAIPFSNASEWVRHRYIDRAAWALSIASQNILATPQSDGTAIPAEDVDEFATVEAWEHDDQRELSLLYNHKAHDGPQFNRGQMREAIRHGKSLATAPKVASDTRADYNGHVPNKYVPPLPEGAKLFAVNYDTATWHYINHAGTWQGMPSPLRASDTMREAIAREVKRVRFVDRYGNDYRADDERLDHVELDAADRILAALSVQSPANAGQDGDLLEQAARVASQEASMLGLARGHDDAEGQEDRWYDGGIAAARRIAAAIRALNPTKDAQS